MGGKDEEGLMVDEKVGHEAKRNMNCFLQLHVTAILLLLFSVFRIRIRIIWPDPFQTIRIRVASKA